MSLPEIHWTIQESHLFPPSDRIRNNLDRHFPEYTSTFPSCSCKIFATLVIPELPLTATMLLVSFASVKLRWIGSLFTPVLLLATLYKMIGSFCPQPRSPYNAQSVPSVSLYYNNGVTRVTPSAPLSATSLTTISTWSVCSWNLFLTVRESVRIDLSDRKACVVMMLLFRQVRRVPCCTADRTITVGTVIIMELDQVRPAFHNSALPSLRDML